jgi:hypothetical protein
MLKSSLQRGSIEIDAPFVHVLAERLGADDLLAEGQYKHVGAAVVAPPGNAQPHRYGVKTRSSKQQQQTVAVESAPATAPHSLARRVVKRALAILNRRNEPARA